LAIAVARSWLSGVLPLRSRKISPPKRKVGGGVGVDVRVGLPRVDRALPQDAGGFAAAGEKEVAEVASAFGIVDAGGQELSEDLAVRTGVKGADLADLGDEIVAD
jgi:hypothetical protein